MYDPDEVFLLTAAFFKACTFGISPSYISVINVSMYKEKI